MVQDLLSYLIQKAAPCQRGRFFIEIRDLSSAGRHADTQTSDDRSRTTHLVISRGGRELKNLPALYSAVSIVRIGILRYASLKFDCLTSPCLRVPIPQLPADTGFHSFGLYEQRGGKAWRHSFISRKRAFHGNGDRRTEVITSEFCRSRCTDNEIPHKNS